MLVTCQARNNGVWRKAFARATLSSCDDARSFSPVLVAGDRRRSQRTSGARRKPFAIRSVRTGPTRRLRARSSRPKTAAPMLDEAKRERLRAILHETPRSFGKPTSLWTLRLAAEVCFEQGVTCRRVSIDSIRRALQRMGVGWKRAKHWITSPDPHYALKKSNAIG